MLVWIELFPPAQQMLLLMRTKQRCDLLFPERVAPTTECPPVVNALGGCLFSEFLAAANASSRSGDAQGRTVLSRVKFLMRVPTATASGRNEPSKTFIDVCNSGSVTDFDSAWSWLTCSFVMSKPKRCK